MVHNLFLVIWNACNMQKQGAISFYNEITVM